MDNEEEQVDASNQQEDADLDTANDSADTQEETIDDVKAKLAKAEEAKTKAEEIAENQRIRAEKAERKAKETEKPEAEPPAKPTEASKKADDGLSSMDTIALINAKVTEKEDIDEVLDYAKHKGISVAEALKTSVIKTILSERADHRATQEATNAGASRRGSAKPTSEQIMSQAAKGKLPEDPEDLADAWLDSKRNK